ncbi:Trm112 family protein [Allosaccharopolyspora coralli]|uniref:UPF0434 protein GIY23_18770 n=1 Tax=Allosaccharopolyspora coralli TaxID=2665642 RepID=A0A5Q3QA87_9PSEU|nr:Trm112 family protein [Allosaccharopolyspora coralli]QGK71293.1 Trm112 family protein [Allosaccharopolyspora coralli]
MTVDLEPQLLQILACPAPDHGTLRQGTDADPSADVLTCTDCGRVYPVRDGIPVLLLDEADSGSQDGAGPDDEAGPGKG